MSYYKISGEKSETARIIIIDESDWSVESNTVVSGSGAYSIDTVASGSKTIIARTADGWSKGFGSVDAAFVYEAPPASGPTYGVFGGGVDVNSVPYDTIDYITITSTGDATDFGNLTAARGDNQGTSNLTRGIFTGGYTYVAEPEDWPGSDVIDYITISTPGNAQDFGNLSSPFYGAAATSNDSNDRGISAGGQNPGIEITNTIDYVTISSVGNANNFGDCTSARYDAKACSNGTNERGLIGPRFDSPYTCDYVTINTTSNASTFGNLSELCLAWYPYNYSRYDAASTSNATNERGVFAGGYVFCLTIDYFTINSASNSTYFGDLTPNGSNYGRGDLTGTSNGVAERGIFAAGNDQYGDGICNRIDYITISTAGNAADFGDVTVNRSELGSCAGG